jgi:integrase
LAGKKALEAYMVLKTQGWDAMWGEYKVRKSKHPALAAKAVDVRNIPASVGDFIARVDEKYTFKSQRTRNTYIYSLHKFIADAFEISSGNEKYDYVNGKNRDRLGKIHAIPLVQLTQDMAESWKNKTIKERAGKQGSTTTVNSILRGCKNLFSDRILRAIEMDKSFVSPFKGVSCLPEKSHRYITKFDARSLIEKARRELRSEHRKAYIIFLLAIGAGLRRNEIDKLLWEQVDFKRGKISIHQTPYFTPKTRESSSEISLPNLVAEELALLKEDSQTAFVLDAEIPARPNAGYTHCRCPRDYKALYAWLSQNGITANNPLHTLRKEFGAQICREHGLYMASRALRHSSYAMTERHYVDKTAPVVPSFF